MWLLEKLNKFLDVKKWVAGDNLTYMDFAIYEFEETLQAYDPETFNQLPSLKKHREDFANLPKIKEYIVSDKFLARPFLPPDRCRWY
jgi:glutathione S-transferase